ncbi:hypothetical protein Cflav_PD3359 [Pedosphaera parvula Ellin514]|uniref:Uncharacterized protein n=1 Tax=Pedosphaera parvula (strain Ellin514) TaxID=320771 RepID=B9XIC8_PEDPL|nr:hypothetical protein Cflav_PD3359 [Pedosphaera parvula Ellin514]
MIFHLNFMKKFIFCIAISALALAPSSYAGDAKPCTGKDKVACSADKKDCCSNKSSCSKAVSKSVLMSPKAAAAAGK